MPLDRLELDLRHRINSKSTNVNSHHLLQWRCQKVLEFENPEKTSENDKLDIFYLCANWISTNQFLNGWDLPAIRCVYIMACMKWSLVRKFSTPQFFELLTLYNQGVPTGPVPRTNFIIQLRFD